MFKFFFVVSGIFSVSISFAANSQVNVVVNNQDGTVSIKNPRVAVEGRLHKVGFLSYWGLCKLKGYPEYAGMGTHEWITSDWSNRERLVSIDDSGKSLNTYFSDNNGTDAYITSVKCLAP